MKKQLLNLSFVAAALALYVTAIAAPIEPVRLLNVSGADAIVIDGVKDAAYGDMQDAEYGYPAHLDTYGGESDFNAEFALTADDTYLYIYVECSDDVEHNYAWGVGNAWEFDNFEVFLQLDTATVPTTYNATTVQLRVCRGLDSVESNGRAARTEYKYYMEAQAAGGWLAEVAIPWTAVMSEAMTPEDIMDYVGVPVGFDFAGADSDNDGEDGDPDTGDRSYQEFWDLDGQDGTEDLAWNNTATFGYITLLSLPEGPVGLESEAASSLNVYPNPATNQINIDLEGMNAYEIFNIAGAQVMAGETTGTIDVSSLNSGIYMLKAGNVTQKFTIK